MRRRFEYKDRELEDFIIRFYPAGNYTWTVPPGCTEVDVFLVGAGGGCSNNSLLGVPGGGGGGYTKTYKKDTAGYRDGNAITVTPGQTIEIIVGAGVRGANGGYSQFMSSLYRAEGGHLSQWNGDGNGGGGYGGGAGGNASGKSTKGGDGTVLIRGKKYKS